MDENTIFKTAKMKIMDPFMSHVLRAIGEGGSEKTLSEGLVEIPHFSPEQSYQAKDIKQDYTSSSYFSDYGVADNPEQAFDYAKNNIKPTKGTTYCVFVTHIAKDPSNKGMRGGWRWHKWGEYIGEGEPTHEYLDDEEGFNDGVYVFSIKENI